MSTRFTKADGRAMVVVVVAVAARGVVAVVAAAVAVAVVIVLVVAVVKKLRDAVSFLFSSLPLFAVTLSSSIRTPQLKRLSLLSQAGPDSPPSLNLT